VPANGVRAADSSPALEMAADLTHGQAGAATLLQSDGGEHLVCLDLELGDRVLFLHSPADGKARQCEDVLFRAGQGRIGSCCAIVIPHTLGVSPAGRNADVVLTCTESETRSYTGLCLSLTVHHTCCTANICSMNACRERCLPVRHSPAHTHGQPSAPGILAYALHRQEHCKQSAHAAAV